MILKLEPFSGISGDMFLGAVVPLVEGAEEELRALPARLGLKDVEVSFTRVVRSTIECNRAVVTVRGHAPEEEAAHGHSPDHDHSRHHLHDHHHEHHSHTHTHSHAHAPHRAYRDIAALIEAADLPAGTRSLALDLFRRLGEAEAEMHGIPLDEVHFHEVGGEDAIVDLVGAAWLIDRLSPEAVVCTPVCTGSGFVNTAHGKLPVPAPATLKLLQGMPAFPGETAKEMTTPTGAVILAALNPSFEVPALVSTASAWGAGTRELPAQPNALRASLCEAADAPSREKIVLLQTNLDNISAEDLGCDLIGDLLDAGALDAWLSPILMKKGRPAHKLEVLCVRETAASLQAMILEHLPTLGVRRFDGDRQVLERESETVTTQFGAVEVKVHVLADGSRRALPEYDSCRNCSRKYQVTPDQVRRAALSQWETGTSGADTGYRIRDTGFGGG